jgi:thiamine-monophosphate kinase
VENAPSSAALGEFGLIERIVRRLDAPPPPAGPGDDAAVVRAPDGRLIATTDLLAEEVHFRRDWSSGYDIGRRAAAANIADIAAMGGVATALLVGIAIPDAIEVAWLDDLTDGLRDEAAVVGARIVGGDMIGSRDRVTLAITALGDLGGRRPVLRSGARPGDEVVLVGRTGWAAAGLALLRAGAGEAHPALVTAFRRPVPPYIAGPALADVGATAMCDVSDGLLADVGHLAAASGVTIDLESAALRQPDLDAAGDTLGERPAWELTGGEDHALVATVPGGTVLEGVLAGARRVGTVASGAGVTVDGAPPPVTLIPGHDHFGGTR